MALSRESPNSRLNAIRKFLSLAPPGSARLRLLQVDQTPIPIGEWMPAANLDKREELALEIEDLLIDTASEKRRTRMGFLLAWTDEAGAQKVCRELTVYGHQLPQFEDTPEGTARDLDGTTQSQLSQTQRHLEAMMRMHIQWESNTISTMASTIDRLAERCAQVEGASYKRHDELLEAKETILGLLNEATGNELSPAQQKAFELAERLVPGLVMWFQNQQRNAANGKAANGKTTTEGKVAA